MTVEFYKSFWGMDALPVVERVERCLAAGFDGVEAALPELREVRAAGLNVPAVAMLFVEDPEALRVGLEGAAEVGAVAVNVHAGKDWWDFQHGCGFFEAALDAVTASGLTVCFETHRGRLLYDARSAAAYLRRFPQMRVTADFSHWTCVSESMLRDQEDSVRIAIEQTGHVHARVGFEEGPQVPDPRTERWRPYVERFEEWWDAIHEAHVARGEAVMRVDPEFGPPNYLWTDPSDHDRPVADLFEVCVWMKDRLKTRWV